MLSGLLLASACWPNRRRRGRAANLPPSESTAKAALEKSPRHGEYVDVKMAGGGPPIRTWISYPERKDKAGVVIVIHEIFGLTDWIRGVADQLAKDGFIAVAPDLVSGLGPGGGGTDSVAEPRRRRDARPRASRRRRRRKRLNAVRDWALKLPAGNGKTRDGRLLLGRRAELRLRGRAARARTPPSSTTAARRKRAALATIQAPGARALRRRRRARERDDPAGRGGDEEARQDLRAPHLRGRRPRLPARAGRRATART